ncbi:hypothetical protein TrLO_g2181 [Triparma laevis f. longispina]|uniref:Uncharacterized protein n=1 Tax=Triparma laevis f. longispina TaxID=1714387 RepID=A0A9W7EDG1_9STRA|nr:hypothetical protein TrLO_g2181 [Triparma laevis f. longispina]
MRSMFGYASVFNQDLNKWNVCKVTDFDSMFQGSGMPGTDLSSLKSNCVNCPSGKYSGSGEFVSPEGNPCTGCVAGKYNDSPGSETCTICAAGSYSGSALTSCTVCPAGKYNPDQATSASLHVPNSCTACSPGTKLEDRGTDAERHNADDDCELCGPGYYSNNEEGSASCSSCPDGEVSPAGASACSSCPAGYECVGGTTTPCATGNYSEGGSNCGPCEKGYRCPGGTDRQECLPGSHQSAVSSPTCFPSAEFTSVVEEETPAEAEKRIREEAGLDYEEEEGSSEDEEESEDEEGGEDVSRRTVDMETAKLVKSEIKGWVSLREGGDEYDRDIVKLVPSEHSDKPYLDLRRLRCGPAKPIPKMLKGKVIGAAGAILREGPQLDSKFIKRIPPGTYILVKNVECVSDAMSIMNQRVYVEQMPSFTQHGFEYLYPYNLEVAQPRVIGTPYDDGEARISKPVKCSEHICEVLSWDSKELHSKVECREAVEKYVRKNKLVKISGGKKFFDLESTEEGRKLGELFDNQGKEVTFTNFQPYVDVHAGTERVKTAETADGLGGGEQEEEEDESGSPYKVELVKGDNFLYTGWTSVSSVLQYPILEPQWELLEDHFSPDIKKKKQEDRARAKAEMEVEKRRLVGKLEEVKAELKKERKNVGEEEEEEYKKLAEGLEEDSDNDYEN